VKANRLLFSAVFVFLLAGCSAVMRSGDDLSRKVDYLRQDVETLTKQQQELINEIREQKGSAKTSVTTATEPLSETTDGSEAAPPAVEVRNLSPDPAESYKKAFSLMKEKRYSEAEAAFGGFIRSFPRSDLADNAQYWIGECFYAEGNLESAARAFQGVWEHFPFGNKVPDALYKLAACQRKLGRSSEADKTLERLKKFYPDSPAASKIPAEKPAS